MSIDIIIPCQKLICVDMLILPPTLDIVWICIAIFLAYAGQKSGTNNPPTKYQFFLIIVPDLFLDGQINGEDVTQIHNLC